MKCKELICASPWNSNWYKMQPSLEEPLMKWQSIWIVCCIGTCVALAQEPATAPAIPPNTWVAVKPDFALPDNLKDAKWNGGDGYSCSVYRSKTGGVLIRTGM